MTIHKYTISIIGTENVGKRTLLFELSGLANNKVNHKFKPNSSENIYDLTIYIIDKIGQNDDVLKKSDGIIYVFDKNTPSTLSSVSNFYQHTMFINDSNNHRTPYVLVGNKSDLEEEVSFVSVHNFLNKDGCKYIETSATLGKKVEDAFSNLMVEIDFHKSKYQTTKKVITI
eukprot:gene7183-11495_t